ncbi:MULTISPECIES: DUF58 domain-containing protein [unclassified Saccharibacter]|uniref:DUF58 domain-containing protein n=1 Tax=unclassified Saccharibacter TaxID=2648722 RepID=UPI0013279E64|nr:DUF58 domain-containing protein [Saccharibacter sp. EH611]MXV57415.1 DUF58 domain-containing protein [Saccharibacter sp. EH70]MXV64724.1 DUF58 domain-containing protein [Saccharibacter sp. EH60]
MPIPSFLRSLLPQAKRSSPAANHHSPLPELILSAGKLATALEAGRHGGRKAGHGEDFWQYRPHMPLEPATLVDWKQSARSPNPETLWVRERERQSARQLLLWADRSPSMEWRSTDKLSTKRDAAITALLALGQAALKAGERVGILGGPRCYSGPQHLPRLAHDLIEAPPNPTLHHASPQASLIMASDFLWPEHELDALLTATQKRLGITALFGIFDPQERDFSAYTGHVRFRSDEEPHTLTLPAVSSLRETYQQHLKNHLARLSHGGRSTSFIPYRTDQPMGASLMRLHHVLGEKR